MDGGWLLRHRLGRQDPGSSQVRVCSETQIPECLSSALPAPAALGTGIPSPSTAGILMAPRCVEHSVHPPTLGRGARGRPGVGSGRSRACRAEQ